jgi:hypothetical protein
VLKYYQITGVAELKVVGGWWVVVVGGWWFCDNNKTCIASVLRYQREIENKKL